jgi:hypothetical protein
MSQECPDGLLIGRGVRVGVEDRHEQCRIRSNLCCHRVVQRTSITTASIRIRSNRTGGQRRFTDRRRRRTARLTAAFATPWLHHPSIVKTKHSAHGFVKGRPRSCPSLCCRVPPPVISSRRLMTGEARRGLDEGASVSNRPWAGRRHVRGLGRPASIPSSQCKEGGRSDRPR